MLLGDKKRICVLLFFCFSVSCFTVSSHLFYSEKLSFKNAIKSNGTLDKNDLDQKKNHLFSFNSTEMDKLKENKAQLLDQLSFMFFSSERNKLQAQLVMVIKEQIRLEPYNEPLWKELVFAQKNDHEKNKEQDWAFSVWSKMANWNQYERVNFIQYCIDFKPIETTHYLKIQCRSLIEHSYSLWGRSVLSKKAKLSVKELNALLSHYGVNPDNIKTVL